MRLWPRMATSRRRSTGFPDVAIRLVHEDRTYVREPGERLETDLGVLDIPPDVEPGDELETHLGARFLVRSLRLPDWFHYFERSGAPMLPRDIGMILGETGVGSGDRVLDVGTGTGVLAAAMANTGASVISFERDTEAADTARENLRLAEVADRVEIRTADATEGVDAVDGPVDVLTLDTEDAPQIGRKAPDLLRPGGYLATYSPFVEDARAVVETAREGLVDVRCIETIQRTLDVDERGTRPGTRPVGHTGYLTFGRRR